MRRLFALLTGLCLTLAGCNDAYDDSELVKRMDDFEQRLAKLERLCNDMNTNLGSMQTIVTALDNGDYITSVEPLTENGAVVGYTLKFAKGKPIVIYNGKSGTAPVIAVRKDADGIIGTSPTTTAPRGRSSERRPAKTERMPQESRSTWTRTTSTSHSPEGRP